MRKPGRSIVVFSCALLAVAGAVAGALAAAVPAARAPAKAAAPPAGPGSISGIWLNVAYKGSGRYPERERVLLTADGKFPPLQPWAAELLDKRIADSEAGHPFANTLAQCLPGGVPLMVSGALIPIQVLETPGQVTILYMEGNRHRVIPLNASHPAYVDPSYMGDSVGRWEGDTLIVDSVGFKLRTTIDQIGMPHTAALHVVERYRRSAPDSLEVRIRIEDSGTFTQPWDAAPVTYRRAPAGTRMEEDICENNRNAPDDQGRSGFQHF